MYFPVFGMSRRGGLRAIAIALLLLLVAGLVNAAVRSALQPTANGTALAPKSGEGKIVVLATTGMVADLVAAVGGNRVVVETLLNPGVDPHLYKLTRRDLARMLAADMVVYNGLHLEGRMLVALERLADSGKPVLAIAESLPEALLLESEDYPGISDPHIWMNIGLWRQTLPAVVDGLTNLLPTAHAAFAGNAAHYASTLAGLEQWARQKLSGVPASRRLLLTAHDAFGYFGQAYGYEVMGVQGMSTDTEAGLKRIESLVELLVRRQIPAVFVESSVSDRNVRALIDGASAAGHEVFIGGTLYADALGSAGTEAATYTGMIRHNVKVITRSLTTDGASSADRLLVSGTSYRRQ